MFSAVGFQSAQGLPLESSRVDFRTEVSPVSPPRLLVEAFNEGIITDNTIVCFGMLMDCPVIAARRSTTLPPRVAVPIFATSRGDIYHANTQQLLGSPDGILREVLSRLIDDTELEYQLVLRKEPLGVNQDQKPLKRMLGYLHIILYGPKHRFEDVGDFMTQCNCFLQDPYGCDRDVFYMNAQCLSSLYETPIKTFELPQPLRSSVEELTRVYSDVLSEFETTGPLEETSTPPSLRTSLQTHQRQALTFLLRREQGLHPKENVLGLWKPSPSGNGFTNVITDQCQEEPGPLWRGGLLADEMGLGKTLSMIALIASDYDRGNEKHRIKMLDSMGQGCSTLVIVPLSLIPVWTSQLESHVYDGSLTTFVHHGKSRLQVSQGVVLPNIVLTTYQTIEHEQRGGSPAPDSLSVQFWRRIILDEAHTIRNHRTLTARAIAALNARARWAISGTPVQNSLNDFLGLFKFLQFAPYNDPRVFDDELIQIWRDDLPEEATAVFKKLLSSMMLRRTKKVLDLQPRTDNSCVVPFDEQEERVYRRVEQPVAESLTQANGNSWANTIQQINKLRLICNVGIHGPQKSGLNELASLDGSIRETIGICLSLGVDMCTSCQGPVSLPSIDDSLGPTSSSNTYYTTCGRMYCSACAQRQRIKSLGSCGCVDGTASCPLRPLASSIRTPPLSPARDISPSLDGVGDDFMSLDVKISSKVRALIAQIKSYPTEKHVVFSSWTSSLDMVERGLAAETIASVRIDGSVSPRNRANAVDQLRSNIEIRVILLTISCGACGLDLTAASVAHLLEPQWNPSLEDQALARVHRLGQTRPVTTFRYIMRDSFEEHMLKVQDRKKLLATMLLSDNAAIQSLQNMLGDKQD